MEIKELTSFIAEVDEFDGTMFPPTIEVMKNETYIGIVPEDVRKFYSLARFYARELDQMKLDSQYVKDVPQATLSRMDEVGDKGKLLMAMFWFFIEAHFNLWGAGLEIGIRDGWKIVSSPHRKNPIEKIMERLAGELGDQE